MSESAEVLALAEALARAAGALQRERFAQPREISTKSSAIDLVTDVDRDSEALILERIIRERPDDRIEAEESGNAREGTNGWCWVIDPLDGTTNYAHGYPQFAVSIGVERDGVREVGLIYDPMRDECFSTTRGSGATLNGTPIHVTKCDDLEQALLGTGFAYNVHESRVENLDHFEAFVRRARGVRRAGSAALDLACVAAGRFDGFWEMHLSAWDVAAGLLLIEEAGGTISDFDGAPAPRSGERLVASNGRLHEAMLGVIGTGR